jgi:MoaA/NifB/PqqE/SkfB family radical SAM enzyme
MACGSNPVLKVTVKQRFLRWFRYARRFAGSFWLTNWNALRGASYIPHPRTRLCIETVSFCNLECKFCSYPKKLHPRTVMDDALFQRSVDQAVTLGYRRLALTPINGDVFMDKKFVERLQYIENSSIEIIEFYTNFIGADEAAIASLLSLKKVSLMEISVYGHDADSFQSVTRRGTKQFDRLVDNLNALERLWSHRNPGMKIVISLRTYRSFRFGDPHGNELLEVIERLRGLGAVIGLSSSVDNWGGAIDEDDIADIDMELTDGRYLYKKGPCRLPFDTVQITADGRVNACACRDPGGELTLGDIHDAPLSDILSVDNAKWSKIVSDHETGNYNDVCASCGFYQSIHDARAVGDMDESELMNKERYMALFTSDDN